MPRLVDLNPAWVDFEDRHGLGIFFNCMVGSHHGALCTYRNMILFKNSLDGKDPFPGESRALILLLFPEPDEERWNIVGCGTFRWERIGGNF